MPVRSVAGAAMKLVSCEGFGVESEEVLVGGYED
jgi:hypothetical protein